MQQNKKDLILLRNFGIVKILMDQKGETYLFWDLTREQQKHYGEKINPFLCWKNHKFCKLNLKRLHLTCLTCKLRRVISAEDPYFCRIVIRQIWERQSKSKIKRILYENLLSLTEALS